MINKKKLMTIANNKYFRLFYYKYLTSDFQFKIAIRGSSLFDSGCDHCLAWRIKYFYILLISSFSRNVL